MEKRQQLLGAGSILLSTVLYGLFGILARVVGYTIPIFIQGWTRELVASVIIISLIVVTKQKMMRMTKRDFLWTLYRSIMGTIAFLLFFFCVNAMPIGTTYFMFYGSSTVIAYILGKVLFNEHLTQTKILSMVLALLGLLFVYSINFQSLPLLYLLMAFGSGAATAFWDVAPKKLHTFPTIQLVLLDNILPIPLYIFLSLATHETWTSPAFTPVWMASIAYGCLFAVTGQLVVFGFKRLEAQIGSILALGEIPMAILFAFLFFKETITPMTMLGGILIIIALIIPELNMWIQKTRNNSQNRTHQQ
jgi:drug/metabolite transporter (DMT)-like permease